MKDKVFIQIPAYRDTELGATIHDLFQKAAYKERLRLAIAWQYDKAEEEQENLFRQWPNVELLKIPASESLGCNWARNLLQQQWNGEKYTLFLDSHHRFTPGWDEKVIAMYEKLRKKFQKPIITGYLPSYDPLSDPESRVEGILKIKPLEREKGLLFRLVGGEVPDWKSLEEPIAAHFTSLHFLFAEGSFNGEIEFDPSIYFFADEIAIALRAYTFGYDLFHPHEILGWHLYDRSTRVTHWSDHPEWRRQNKFSYDQLLKLYRGYVIGRRGIGLQRKISEYEEYIGMKLIHDRLEESAVFLKHVHRI